MTEIRYGRRFSFSKLPLITLFNPMSLKNPKNLVGNKG